MNANNINLTINCIQSKVVLSTGNVQKTLYQSFMRLCKLFDDWMLTCPQKISFNAFSSAMDLGVGDYKNLYSFLEIRNDSQLMSMWEEDDRLGRNRITWKNFINVNFPGKTMKEKYRLRKLHLFHLLALPHNVILSNSKARKLVKLLEHGKIIDYKQALDEQCTTNIEFDIEDTFLLDQFTELVKWKNPEWNNFNIERVKWNYVTKKMNVVVRK